MLGAHDAAKAFVDGFNKARRDKAVEALANDEPYDRFERKDFWNDPERWDGIDDPRKTMIWEVRRRDIIDVRPAPTPPPNPYANAAPQWGYGQSPLQAYQHSVFQNCRAQNTPLFGSLFGF